MTAKAGAITESVSNSSQKSLMVHNIRLIQVTPAKRTIRVIHVIDLVYLFWCRRVGCPPLKLSPQTHSPRTSCPPGQLVLGQLDSVMRETHPIPKVDDTLAQLSGAPLFTKLDANSGFWQIPLSEESGLLTTFITPFGKYAFNPISAELNGMRSTSKPEIN